MRRKLLLICGVCLLGVSLIGCEKATELTDEETKLIAEYAADLLLKYDISFEDRIDEGEKKIAKDAENALSTEYPVPPAEAVTEEPTTEKATEESGRDTDGKLEDSTGISGESVGRQSDIAKLTGIAGASITYKDYIVTDQYPPAETGNEFIFLEASDGYQLLVLRFRVAAAGSDSVDISMMDRDIDYRIVCNGSKAANPMLTILTDDLGTLETTVSSGQEQEAVLVFQVSDSMKNDLNTMDLHITYDGSEYVMELQ